MPVAARQPARLTAKGARTRARIVDAAAGLIYQHGVSATTIEDVKAAAEVSGSQLYHYFADKEALVKAVIDRQADTIVSNQLRIDLGTPAGLRAWRDFVVTHAHDTDCRGGCPLGSLAGQLSETDGQARALLQHGFQRWSGAIGVGMTALHSKGLLAPGLDPDDLAVTLLATLQGGLLLAQVQRDSRALATALDTFLTMALAA